MIALATLGLFVFQTNSIPFQDYERSQNWKHPHANTVGGAPHSQYTGKEPEEITINAELRPEITGGDNSIAILRMMADTGQSWPLILGTGRLLGSFVITSIKTKHTELMYDSKARAINFTMTLKKTSDHSFGLKGEALGITIGIARALTGI